MSATKYTEDHESIRIEDDGAVIGISDYAQEQLGEVVFVELPEVGTEIAMGDEAAVVESVKAASEVHAPASGVVTAVNEALADDPGKVNQDPMGDGWFIKIKLSDPSQLDALMDDAAYQTKIAE